MQDFLIGGLSAILSAAKQKKSEPRVPQADITENIAESDGEENLVIDEAEEPEMMDVEPDINIIEGGVGDWEYEGSEEGMYEGGEGEFAGGQYGGVWADGADESMFTDNPMQMCQVQCQVNNIFFFNVILIVYSLIISIPIPILSFMLNSIKAGGSESMHRLCIEKSLRE